MDKQCECCLSSNNLLELTETYTRMILSCFSIELSTSCSFDNSLNRICGSCAEKIYDSSAFRSQILDTQTKLKELYSESITSIDIKTEFNEATIKPEFFVKEEFLSDFDENDSNNFSIESSIPSKENLHTNQNVESIFDNSEILKVYKIFTVPDELSLKRKRSSKSHPSKRNKPDFSCELCNATYESEDQLFSHNLKCLVKYENQPYSSSGSVRDELDLIDAETKKEIERLLDMLHTNKFIMNFLIQKKKLTLPERQLQSIVKEMRRRKQEIAKPKQEIAKPKQESGKQKEESERQKEESERQKQESERQKQESEKRKQEREKLKLDELESWLINNSKIPDDEHQVFVAVHESSENHYPINFRFMLTTKYLISLTRQSNILHFDLVQKPKWHGCPVFIIGTSDKDKNFHPFGMVLTTSEQFNDYVFLFESLKNIVRSMISCDLTPNLLLCDDEQIKRNAFVQVFGQDANVRICWTYVKKKITQLVQKFVYKTTQKDILKDIDALQCAGTKAMFDQACEKFLDKWKSQKDFITYFKCKWIMQNRLWYLGAIPHTPATNKSLSWFWNSWVLLYRAGLPVDVYFKVVTDMIGKWSQEYVTNGKKFARLPTISMKTWVEALKWAHLPNRILSQNVTGSNECYRVPDEEALEGETLKDTWETFDEYKKPFRVRDVELPKEKADWLNGTCKCPTFFKDFVCKHLVGLAIHFRRAKVPIDARVKWQAGLNRKLPWKLQKAILVP